LILMRFNRLNLVVLLRIFDGFHSLKKYVDRSKMIDNFISKPTYNLNYD